ncbi:serine/threonine-protein kinase-like protein CCR1 [Herrania umbratica]|uniref:Serine/threonine-protein kinase-like protein CCR1 n=1 Tax=Herrania umbratica TaxID=108875 RepID=A0A6J1AS55_9ROSI|nr:serine/threonine-protein kinase-like protein CCR1 [Herrania umbratica]
MQILKITMFLLLLLLISAISASGFGSMGPISAAFGEDGFFCAIDASGKQAVICWSKNSSSASSSSATSSTSSSLSSLDFASQVPQMAALSGGEGFLCGILANTSQVFCWSLMGSGTDLVPRNYKTTAYSYIASGKNHVCGIRGAYYSDHESGIVDCWEIVKSSNNTLSSKQSSLFYDQSVSNLVFKMIISGEGFSCGGIREGGLVCWGPNAEFLGVSNVSDSFLALASAVLADGRQVAVKRANAATIIHGNSRDFEMELEILCNVRHCNIVNLIGYCSEMGERLLVYEYMPHGTLHDHLHGGLSPLSWSLRLKIALQAARGLEYLHKEVAPPIVHRHVKTSNILLDSERGARIADFGLLTSSERDLDLSGDMKSDVYSFGIVLVEILSGRKAFDRDYTPPSIIDWALPLIKQGKAAAIIDRFVTLPRNVEPLLKLADVAELAVREDPSERPTMSDLVNLLQQIVKDGLVL